MTSSVPDGPVAAHLDRLRDEPNLWFASTRPDGRAHLIPIWFGYVEGRFYVCTQSSSVKVRNVRQDPRVVVALESGSDPVAANGLARCLERPFPEPVKVEFMRKFDWDLDDEPEYDVLIEVEPTKWRLRPAT